MDRSLHGYQDPEIEELRERIREREREIHDEIEKAVAKMDKMTAHGDSPQTFGRPTHQVGDVVRHRVESNIHGVSLSRDVHFLVVGVRATISREGIVYTYRLGLPAAADFGPAFTEETTVLETPSGTTLQPAALNFQWWT